MKYQIIATPKGRPDAEPDVRLFVKGDPERGWVMVDRGSKILTEMHRRSLEVLWGHLYDFTLREVSDEG